MKISEEYIVDRVIDFLVNKKGGNWHLEKIKKVNCMVLVLI